MMKGRRENTGGPSGLASHSKCVGQVPPFKCTGQWVSILMHGPVLLQVVWLVHIYIWIFALNGPK